MANIDYYSDFHCHPSMKAFYSSKNHDSKKNLWEFIDKSTVCGGLPKILQKQIREMVKFSQMNLDACKKGRVGVVFSSLYPIERGWFDENNLTHLIISGELFTKSAICSSGLNADVIKEFVGNIEQNKAISYFNDLAAEYYYLNSEKAKSDNSEDEFIIANCYDDIQSVEFSNEKTKIVLILNIEGCHSLLEFKNYRDLKKTHFRKLNKPKFQEYKDYKPIIFNNIDIIKGLKPKTINVDGNDVELMFNHTPLYITFAHHFWNLLCGHADSLNIGGDIVLNQNRGKNRKFTLLGKKVLRYLLERDTDKRRILIDIKHLSIRARKGFFKIHKQKYAVNGDIFPIISSHSAVNGRNTYLPVYREQIEEMYFNAGDINLFDEDIKNIVESDGLIGIMLNELRLMGFQDMLIIKKNKKRIRKLQEHSPESDEIQHIKKENEGKYLLSILSHMFHIVNTANNISAWNCICIGSDFDGMIDALDDYVYAYDIKRLKADLLSKLNSINNLSHIGIDNAEFENLKKPYTNTQILNKVFHTNTVDFLKKYYHDDYLKFGIKH